MLLGSDDTASPIAYFNDDSVNMIANEEYTYRYTMDVMDINNPLRVCETTPSITISISTIPDEPDHVIVVPLLVVNIQPNENIYIDTPVRLIGKLSILDPMDQWDNYYYKDSWTEINGQISDNDLIIMSNAGNIDQKNLIIDPFSLREGNSYQFQLTVDQYQDSEYQTYLQTIISSIFVNVNVPDITVINSTIVVEDDCTKSPIQYQTFNQLFEHFFNISFNGEDALENKYQFGYLIKDYMNNQKILLHSNLLKSQTYFNRFVLPLSSSIIFHVDIFDNQYKSVEVNTTNVCIIEFDSIDANSDECISYKEDIYDKFKYHQPLQYLIWIKNYFLPFKHHIVFYIY